jgi:exodeoxyribonuclease (lambda-induced)
METHNIDQRSEEWFEIRRGKMTASNAQCIAANGKGLESYIFSVLAEKYSNNRDNYSNGDMERGVELEDQARMTYEIFNDQVRLVGLIEIDEFSGCSPDGLIGENGGIEIKCPNDVNFFKLIVDGEKAIDAKYLWQVQMCLFATQRKWWDLVFYNPNFDKNMLIFRIVPELAKQEKIILGLEKGKNLIKDLEQKYGKNSCNI